MRNKKYIKTAIGLFLAALIPAYTFSDLDFKVANIDVADEGTLEIWLNANLADALAIDTDMQVVEDTDSISEVVRDYEDLKKVEVKLNEDLKVGEYYSLISISWADGNMAFNFPENFYDTENVVLEGEELSWVISMEIKNSKTLVLNLETEAESIVEMKLLRELWVNNLEKTSERTIKVTLDKKMQSNKDYTLTVIKLESMDGKEVSMENSTIDFTAPEFAPPVEMNAAPEEPVVTEKKELPPTGTKENIIIILSLLLGGIIVYRKEKLQA